MKINSLCILACLLLISFAACDKNDDLPISPLQRSGLLGEWKFHGITINGITGPSIQCCNTLKFLKKGHFHALIGDFMATGEGYQTTGEFVLDRDNNTICFKYDEKVRFYQYQVQGNYLIFLYEEDSSNIEESWIKID